MRRILAAIALAPSLALAAPSISSLSGTWTDGATITISGSNFGTKSPAAPLVWDTFESYTAGSNLTSPWTVETACPGKGSTAEHYGNTGSKSALQHLSTNAACWTRVSLGAQSAVYVSYNFYSSSTGASGDHCKFGRVTQGDDVHSTPRMGYSGHSPSYAQIFNGDTEVSLASYDVTQNVWTRDEYFFTISTIDTSDGLGYTWRNGESKYASTALETYSTGASGSTYAYFFLPYYNESGPRDIYIDNVYVDKTRARVELCYESSSPTGSTTSHCEIQIPTAWSATSITVTANLGLLDPSAAFVYVVDSSGVWSNAKAAGSVPPVSTRRVNGAN